MQLIVKAEANPKILTANSPGSCLFLIYSGYIRVSKWLPWYQSASKNRFVDSSLCIWHHTRGWLFSDQMNMVSAFHGLYYLLSKSLLTLCQRVLSKKQFCPYHILAQKLLLILSLQNLLSSDPQDQDLIWATSDHPPHHLLSSQTFHSPNNPCLFLFPCSRSLCPFYMTLSFTRIEPRF